MAFTRKNIIFNTNSKRHSPFRLQFCYLAPGTYDNPNFLGNTGIQTQYVVLMQSSQNFLHSALQIIGVFNLRYASFHAFFKNSFRTFSIMLRSALWAGHGKLPKEFSRFHSFVLSDTGQAAFSSKVQIQGRFLKCCATIGYKFSSRIQMYLSVLIFPLTGVSVPTP